MEVWVVVFFVGVVVAFLAGLVWGSRRRRNGRSSQGVIEGFFGFYGAVVQQLPGLDELGPGRIKVEEEEGGERAEAFLPRLKTRAGGS